jgi:phospholipid/cholesterol/gamma-HCH transport system ATP-binding protein
VVTHELASIFAIADTCLYLDVEERTLTARGNPHDLLRQPGESNVKAFLSRGEGEGAAPAR